MTLCTHSVQSTVSLVPRLLPVLHTEKAREHGKIHHMRDMRWKGIAMARAPFKNLHFLPVQACLYLAIQVCLVQLFAIVLLRLKARCVCVCRVRSLVHMMNFTMLPCFSACIIEKKKKTSEEPWFEARALAHSVLSSLLHYVLVLLLLRHLMLAQAREK